MKLRILALLALMWPALALAQTSPNLTYGQVLTPGQWNALFAGKQDTLGYTPVNRGGDTMFGPLKTLSPTAQSAGLVVTPGLAPTAPADGSIWITNTGLFVQVNGSTIGPIQNGNVTGPSVSVIGDIATFGATNGGVLVDSGKTLPTGTIVGTSDTQTLTNKSISADQVNSGILGTARIPPVTSAMLATGAAAGNLGYTPLAPANNLSDVAAAATAWTNLGGGSIGKLSTVSLTSNVTGTLPVGNGGIGAATLTANGILLGNGTAAVTPTAAMTNGQLLVGQTSAAPLPKTVSGDCTLAASGAATCTKLNGVSPGTAYPLNVGTAANNIVQLDGSAKLPAVDGSQLINLPNATAVYAPGTIYKLTLSNDATTPNTVIDIASGVAVNDDGSTAKNMVLASAITKSISSTWTAGTGNGCLDTGTVAASTWYHIFLISNASNNVDALCSTSLSSPTMPSGYTARRRIGSIKTNASSQILAFTQIGDTFLWSTSVTDASAAITVTTPQLVALSVPPGVNVLADVMFRTSNASTFVQTYAYSPYVTAEASNATGNPLFTAIASSSVQSSVPQRLRLMTNTSQQIGFVNNSTTSTNVYIVTYGYVDMRGRG